MKTITKYSLLLLLLINQLSGAGPIKDKIMERSSQQKISTNNELEEVSDNQNVTLPKGAKLTKNISYGINPRQQLDVYSDRGVKNAPIILMVHGGGWRNGDKSMSNVVQNKVAYFVPKGYIFISINTRLLPEATPLEQAEDVAKALKFVQINGHYWNGDVSKIILMGHSAGAHLVTLLTSLKYPDINPWKATVALDSAAYDVNLLMTSRHMKLFDDAFGQDPQNWTNSSPIHRLQNPNIPILLVCSSKRKVSCEQSELYLKKFNSLGGNATIQPVEMSHSEINKDLGEISQYTLSIENFILDNLK